MSTDVVRVPKQGALSDLAAWIAGELGSCLVKLYVSNTVYTPDRIPSDYTEASFAGYAPIAAPSWGVPFTNVGGKAETDSPTLTWAYTAASGTATVFGVFVTDTTGTKLLLVVPFITPETLTPGSPTLTRTLQLTEVSEL